MSLDRRIVDVYDTLNERPNIRAQFCGSLTHAQNLSDKFTYDKIKWFNRVFGACYAPRRCYFYVIMQMLLKIAKIYLFYLKLC